MLGGENSGVSPSLFLFSMAQAFSPRSAPMAELKQSQGGGKNAPRVSTVAF